MTPAVPTAPGPLRLVVLGGSSPATPALVDALAAAPDLGPGELVLFGRDRDALALVSRHAAARLAPSGWLVRWTDGLVEALSGATVVIHQIRYGGLAGRSADERLAAGLGLPADETQGPGGLQAGLRSAVGMRPVTLALADACPALVINLVNPLGLSTAVLADAGVPVVGVCEVPVATVWEACAVLGVPAAEVRWQYAGLNHRGFVLRVELAGRDLLPGLPSRLGGATLGGVDAATISALRALPTKYHALHLPGAGHRPGRASALRDLRARVLAELHEQPDRTPPSLTARPAEWYPLSVVPLLRAVSAAVPSRHVVNLPGPDGLVREGWAAVAAGGIVAEPRIDEADVPGPVRRWLRLFEDHERAALAATRRPQDQDRVRAALALDPLLPPQRLAEAAEAVSRHVREYAAATSPS